MTWLIPPHMAIQFLVVLSAILRRISPSRSPLPMNPDFQATTNWNVDDLERRFELVLRRNLAGKQQCDGVPAAMALDEMYVHECSTVDSTVRCWEIG